MVIAMRRFFVFMSVGPNATDFAAMRKSPGFAVSTYSVAVPVLSTSTANVVDEPGRWLTVTGTSSMPPETFSATRTACFDVPAASLPNATLASSSSPSPMVTVAVAPEDAAFQPAAVVDSVASNVSSPSTRSSSASGIVSVAVLLFAATVTEAGVVPVSSADALPE